MDFDQTSSSGACPDVLDRKKPTLRAISRSDPELVIIR